MLFYVKDIISPIFFYDLFFSFNMNVLEMSLYLYI